MIASHTCTYSCREYAWAMHALAPSTPTAASVETIVAFHHLHPLVKVDLPPFVDNFHLKTDLVLDKKAFILFGYIFHVFHPTIPRIWFMSFCEIVLSMMILLVALIFLRYVDTSLVVNINIMLACCIMTIGFGETSQRRLINHNWRGDLSISHLHTNYLVQGYICRAF